MASYMLFVPGAAAGDGPASVARFHLSDLERDCDPLSWLASKGPGPAGAEVDGLLGGWLDMDPRKSIMTYQPTRQTWRQCPGLDLWLGVENDNPVRPSDLERKICRDGHYVRLADGQDWLIPVAKLLPHVLGLNEFRQSVRKPKPQFEAFCVQAEQVLASFLENSTDDVIKCAVDWDFVCDTLALNYRLFPDAIDMLGLVDDRAGVEAMAAVCDMQAIHQVVREKKTAECADMAAT